MNFVHGLPLSDSSFDVAFAGCVFHHTDASCQSAWLHELRRALAVGSRADRPRYYLFFPRPLRSLRPVESYMNWLALGGHYYVVGWRD